MLASDVHFPADTAAALTLLETLLGALVFAGGTSILKEKADRVVELPPAVLCIHRIQELRRIARTEGALELGACVTLTELCPEGGLGLPDPLPALVETIGTRPLRNQATLGGNLATRDRFMTLWPLLSCLDAMAELRDSRGSRWVKVSRLVDADDRPAFPARALLCRVRIPLESPGFRLLSRSGTPYYTARDTTNFACTANVATGTLSAFKLILAGERCFRSRDTETALSGRKLPLSVKDADAFTGEYVERYRAFLQADKDWRGPGVEEFGALTHSVFQRLSR